MPDKIFNNLLLTFKKTGDENFETLYVSKGFFRIFSDPLKFYQSDFFNQIFPTTKNPVFETIYDFMGRGENLEVPFFLNQSTFNWVRIEGFTMAQPEGTYLVNAMINPIRPSQIHSSWIVHAETKRIFTDFKNPSGYFPENLEAFCRYLHEKYSISDTGKLKQLCEGHLEGLELDLGILKLDINVLENGYHLLTLKKDPKRPGVPNLIEEESNYLSNSFLGIIYFEYLKEDREIIWSGAINELLGYQESRFKRFSVWDWLEIIHPDDRNKVRDLLFTDHYEKDAYTFTYQVKKKNGEYLHLKNSLKVFYNIPLKKTILVGILNDVSDIRQAQKHLKEKDGLLQHLSDKEFIQKTLQEVSEISTLFKGSTLFDEINQLIFKRLGFTYGMIANLNPVNHSYELISVRKSGKKLKNTSEKWTKFINEELYKPYPQSSLLIKDIHDLDLPIFTSFLEKNGISSLIRLDLLDKKNIKIGSLCFLHDKPLLNTNLYKELFRILGDWIGKELLQYRFESTLQETNFMHDAILNGTAYAIFAVNHQFETTLINNKTLPVFNLKKKDNLMETMLIKDGKKHSLQEVITQFSKSEKNTAYYLLPHGEEDFKELKISFTRIKYGRKNKVTYVVFVDDITDRTHSEKKLIASEQLYRSIAENFPRGTIDVLDKSFNYIFTDGEEYRLSNTDPKKLFGTNHLDQYSGENLAITKKNLEKILQGKTVSYEIEANQQRFLKIGVPLTNHSQVTDRILLVKQNITEAKKLEAEREKLIKDLKSHNEELLRFAYIVSHNLRAPIVNISLLIDLFNEEDPADPENKEVLENLKISTNLLDATLQDLIEVVSIKKQKIPKVEPIDFKMLLNNVEKSLFNQLKESGIKIHKDFSGLEVMNYVYAHLENFFMNFMTNAVKYRHPDRPPEVWISTYKEKNYCVIRFEDNGIGLDLERYGDRIFGLYQRFHNHVEGKGLGLYLVREQIRANDGKIKIESEVGKGTVFKIHLRNLIMNQPTHRD
ncbi:PAS domain-containing sensor histidine kinase [Cyclobacterium sp.]|uniref:sensor histidine kinase n=1 Tax=Cyclobacterium sp. TaxID=1966343 RepID=UPI00199A2BFA|nr:PAS domain-containing sensor histidine kinase [Cyclobacterium sp.]MBD3629774.1 PAS domain-containing sensor histidine kinase [Cyclobacterium sp.]